MALRRTPIHIAVLGDPAIRIGHAAVDLGSAKLRAVLALLVLHADKVVSTATLISSLWGGDPPYSARHLLHTYVARLRQLIEPEAPQRARVNVISSGPHGYQLLTSGVEIDVTQFRRLRDLAAHQSDPGQAVRAFDLLGGAVRLWRDPSLRGLDDLLPHSSEVEGLRREWVEAALEYVTLGIELGKAATVWPLAERLAKAEPMDERVQARYLVVLDQVGRRASAIAHYQDLHAQLSDELGVEPGHELAVTYRKLLSKEAHLAGPAEASGGASARSPWRGPGAGLSELLDRHHELQVITDHLAIHRLISVTGPPGAGKSHLALHAAALLHDRFSRGVLVLDCAEVGTGEVLRARLLTLLGQTPGTELVTAIAGQQLLLVFDNAEGVVDTVATTVDEILRGCWQVSVIVSSREPLGLPDETVLRLAPLPVPPLHDAAWPGELASVKLFVRRACQVNPSFRLGPDNAPQVARICRELDGLPLAVEMTAACLATDDIETVVGWLRNPLHDIRPLRRGRPEHHRCLWAALYRSVEFLSEVEMWCFRRLGTLPDRFRLPEAVAACRSRLPRLDVERVLARLVDKSLLLPQHGPHGTGYGMLRLLHRLAAELADGESRWRLSAPRPATSPRPVTPLVAVGAAPVLP
jgi:predicted ATPase/DNA-binding SARP family transcriptional activator